MAPREQMPSKGDPISDRILSGRTNDLDRRHSARHGTSGATRCSSKPTPGRCDRGERCSLGRREVQTEPGCKRSRAELRPCSGRYSGGGSHRHHGLPRRPVFDERGLLLARHVLRSVRLSHHDTARRRMAAIWPDSPRSLLGASCPSPVASASRARGGGRRLCRALLGARYLRGASTRRLLDPLLRRELALHPHRIELLRPHGPDSPLLHTWSLAVEEQFYLFWPLVVIAVVRTRLGLRLLLGVCIAGALGSAALMAVLYSLANQNRVYYGTDTRAQSLLVGAALSVSLTLLAQRRAGAGDSHQHAICVGRTNRERQASLRRRRDHRGWYHGCAVDAWSASTTPSPFVAGFCLPRSRQRACWPVWSLLRARSHGCPYRESTSVPRSHLVRDVSLALPFGSLDNSRQYRSERRSALRGPVRLHRADCQCVLLSRRTANSAAAVLALVQGGVRGCARLVRGGRRGRRCCDSADGHRSAKCVSSSGEADRCPLHRSSGQASARWGLDGRDARNWAGRVQARLRHRHAELGHSRMRTDGGFGVSAPRCRSRRWRVRATELPATNSGRRSGSRTSRRFSRMS